MESKDWSTGSQTRTGLRVVCCILGKIEITVEVVILSQEDQSGIHKSR